MKLIGYIGTFIFILLLIILIATIPVMLLWNWLIPDIFGLTTIIFW